ncbi:MAG: hypothetical protein ACRC4W_06770 [Treponemataceae bacterium]
MNLGIETEEGSGSDEGLVTRVQILENDKAEKTLVNINEEDFYAKGIASGLGVGGSGEIQNRVDMFVVGFQNNIVSLSAKKPTQSTPLSIPFNLSQTATNITFRYVYGEDGIISPLSMFDMVLCASNIPVNTDLIFVATISANVNKVDIPIGVSNYTNRYSISNPRMEIPVENNNLTQNVERKANDYLQVVLSIKKSSGNTGSINFLSSNVLDSKLVRNGGDISSTNVFDHDGTNTKSVSQRFREVGISISGKQNMITGAAATITSSNLLSSKVVVTDSSGKVAASSITTTNLSCLIGITENIQDSLTNILDIISSMQEKITKLESDMAIEKEVVYIPQAQAGTIITLKSGFSVNNWTCYIKGGVLTVMAYIKCPSIPDAGWKDVGTVVKPPAATIIGIKSRTTSSVYQTSSYVTTVTEVTSGGQVKVYTTSPLVQNNGFNMEFSYPIDY